MSGDFLVHVDEVLCSHSESFATVLSSIAATAPKRNSFISVDFDHRITGASFGLALSLCISCAPPVLATGTVAGIGETTDAAVYPVDRTRAKLAFAETLPFPLYVSSRTPKAELVASGREATTYTVTDYLADTSLSLKFAAVCVENLAEALLISALPQTRPAP